MESTEGSDVGNIADKVAKLLEALGENLMVPADVRVATTPSAKRTRQSSRADQADIAKTLSALLKVADKVLSEQHERAQAALLQKEQLHSTLSGRVAEHLDMEKKFTDELNGYEMKLKVLTEKHNPLLEGILQAKNKLNQATANAKTAKTELSGVQDLQKSGMMLSDGLGKINTAADTGASKRPRTGVSKDKGPAVSSPELEGLTEHLLKMIQIADGELSKLSTKATEMAKEAERVIWESEDCLDKLHGKVNEMKPELDNTNEQVEKLHQKIIDVKSSVELAQLENRHAETEKAGAAKTLADLKATLDMNQRIHVVLEKHQSDTASRI